MYSKLPNLVFGFHGCDKEIADNVIKNKVHMSFKKNSYDWLGNGVYFWEQNLNRAWDWAREYQRRGKIKDPAVIGAVIDLGYCLNLLDSRYIEEIKTHYERYKYKMDLLGEPLPENKNVGNSKDLLLRHLDCAVIEDFHIVRKHNNEQSFDSVRGLFTEGKEIYPNSGFCEKSHIQICIRNPNCIKACFDPIDSDLNFTMP